MSASTLIRSAAVALCLAAGASLGDDRREVRTLPTQEPLRAERSPSGIGRLYQVWYEASDKAGNTLKLPALVAMRK
ncbi:MAG: hypothetical protein HZA90_13480 [Verrucomicrobia bacterium]|nr:hypothetical protein [Verrucomicrobiota bacterium]